MKKILRILLKSNNIDHLNKNIKILKESMYSIGTIIKGPVSLPSVFHRFWLNKSPHVYKRSQEKFHMQIHRRLIDLENVNNATITKLMSLELSEDILVNIKTK